MTIPRIFVINMPRHEERRQSMLRRAKDITLDIEFFEAVDGASLSKEQLSFYDSIKRKKYFGRDLQRGEIGCLLSHRGIYEKMIRENIPSAIILEDDIIFENDASSVFDALNKSSVKWDVVRFLGSKKIYKRGCRIIAPLIGRYFIARLPTAPGGAHGYIIKLEAARVMLTHMQRNWLPIDSLQGRMWETGLETLVVYPAPLFPDDQEASTIGDKRFDKTLQLKGLAHWLYPLNRAWFKLEEAVGKKYIYLSSWFRDRAHF